MSKYIIEIEDEPFVRRSALYGEKSMYRAKGFNSLVFDQFGLDKLTPLDKELEEAYQKGLHDGTARNENGCVGCIYDNGRIDHSPCDYCCNAYSNQWLAKEKSDEIKVGDEVMSNNAISDHSGIVLALSPGGNSAKVLEKDGGMMWVAVNVLTKTGRHFNFLASLLNAMKEGAE